MPFPIAILASGNGTNAQAMIDKMQAGLLDIDIVLIASNNPKAKVLERAKKAGLAHLVLDHHDYPDREHYDQALLAAVLAHKAQAVVLAGYMRLLSRTFLQGFPGQVLNLHPALLPSFPGLHGARDAMEYGVKLTGATVHFVNEIMDNGPVIIQAAVPVKDGEDEETLLTRIHAMEHRIYPQAVQWLATGRLRLKGRSVELAQAKTELAPGPEQALIWPPLEAGF
ncbi:MAG: phosphoribosylglycinamide formyltransferase [Desulfovibrio sp.]|nr:phosphoribosylglycinamide formyltransferase [Desulfovibrio sp.]